MCTNRGSVESFIAFHMSHLYECCTACAAVRFMGLTYAGGLLMIFIRALLIAIHAPMPFTEDAVFVGPLCDVSKKRTRNALPSYYYPF